MGCSLGVRDFDPWPVVYQSESNYYTSGPPQDWSDVNPDLNQVHPTSRNRNPCCLKWWTPVWYVKGKAKEAVHFCFPDSRRSACQTAKPSGYARNFRATPKHLHKKQQTNEATPTVRPFWFGICPCGVVVVGGGYGSEGGMPAQAAGHSANGELCELGPVSVPFKKEFDPDGQNPTPSY